LAQHRPTGRVRPVGQTHIDEPQAVQQRRVELRFQRSNCDVPAVGAGVGVVERSARVEQVGAAHIAPPPAGPQRPEHLGQCAHAVYHGGIDHLTSAGALAFPQRGQHSQQQEHRATTEVADQVQRGYRLTARRADGVQHARYRDVVDVMPSTVGERAVLPPPGHPRVHQPRVIGLAVGRTDT
jgi:hypothetical protein